MEPVIITGTVIPGHNRGSALGFPTINIETIDPLPEHGVYAGWVEIDDTKYMAAVHIGPVPTFGEETISVEAHLIGFTGDAYNKPVKLTCEKWIRKVEDFHDIKSLQEQIARDVDEVEQTLNPKL